MYTPKPCIAYIDDDFMSREILAVLLTAVMGLSDILIFESSARFLKGLEHLETPPDVVFLDIHMQPYNGVEVLEMLRANAAFRQTRIIALTASVTPQEVAALREAGFHGLIGKPLMAGTFPDLLQRILNGEAIWKGY